MRPDINLALQLQNTKALKFWIKAIERMHCLEIFSRGKQRHWLAAEMTCAFVFVFAKINFSHDANTIVQTFCHIAGARDYMSSSKMQSIRYALLFPKIWKAKLIAPGRLYFKYMLMERGNVILIAGNKCPLAARQVFSNVLIYMFRQLALPFAPGQIFFLATGTGLISSADSRHL